MNYRSKLFIDRLIGPPVGFISNIAALLAGAVLRRDHSFKPLNGREIMICKIVGMGSIVEFSPSLRALKKRYPDVRITFITSASNKECMQMLREFTDDVLYINDRNFATLFLSFCSVTVRMMRKRSDTFLNLEVYSYFTTFLSLLSLSRNRYGYYRKSTAFRKGIDTHHVYFNTKKSIREIYAELLKLLDVTEIDYSTVFPFYIRNEQVEKAEAFIKSRQIGHFIIINSNASDLMPERRWDTENWKAVISHFMQKTNYTVLLSGSLSEHKIVATGFANELSTFDTRVYNIAGQFALDGYVYLLKNAVMIISNDSGPLHLAFSQQSSSLSLWGPTDPDHLSIKQSFNIDIYKNVYCSPCLHNADRPPCNGNNICMKQISPSEVIEKAMFLLKRAG